MTICVESYVGEEGGEEGVKLEQQALIRDDGVELLSSSRSSRRCSEPERRVA